MRKSRWARAGDWPWKMNDNETQRIAAAINALRPDWPTQSLATLITSKLGNRTRRDVAVALTWIACDSNTRTPARVLEAGPWWLATSVEGGGRPVPWEERCCICSMPELSCRRASGGEHEFRPNGTTTYAVDDVRGGWLPEDTVESTVIQLARANLSQAKARLCPHGIEPRLCADHDPRRQKPDAEIETEPATKESADA